METMSENRRALIYILIAFTFSVLMRLIWVYQFQDYEQFRFNDQLMINTNDGYFYAEGARDIINGVTKVSTDLSGFQSATSQLTAFIAQILPFSFESIILYMPLFFASLLVIPIILIGKTIKSLEVGFIAALLATIAWSYYNRTMVGYYDTDLLNIVFPTFLLWSLMWAIKTQEDKYLLLIALDIIAYRWWYPQSYSLEFSFFILIALYVIYQYIKKQEFQYNLLVMTFMMFAMAWTDGWIRFGIVLGLFIVLKVNRKLVVNYIYYIFGFSLLLFILLGGLEPIWGKLSIYTFRNNTLVTGENLQLHFFSVMQTVREAGKIPFETFANRISGDSITFILSLIGYAWLVFKHRVMFLGIPLIALGFLAYSSGLKFTIYAVPMLALGIAFLIVELSNKLNNITVKYGLMTVLTIAILVPNIEHIIAYKVPTVFTKNEVNVLDKLKTIADREDYVVGWWDYGYPIRYYSDVKTLSDGNKHGGDVNFATSFALTHPQEEGAKILRLDVEYTESKFNMDKNNSAKSRTNIANMILDYGLKNSNDFLLSLQTDLKLPKKTRDIYLYLPNKMMNIYPTIALFSNLDLMSGTKGKRPFFYISRSFKQTGNSINLGNNVTLSLATGELHLGKQIVKINRFVTTSYDKSGKLHTQIQKADSSSTINVIFMRNYNQFLVVDNSVYNSLYIQLFVLENYNKELFEPTILTPLTKVYKLKI